MKLSMSRGGRGVGGATAPAKRPSLSRTLWRTVESLPSADQIERLVTREVARAERNGLHFSLALFRVRRGGRFGLNEKRLALTLLRRARLTDEVGWFDEEHLCAVLPDTCALGAQIFADAVCGLIARKGPRPIAVVYSFPLDWFQKDEAAGVPSTGRSPDAEDDDDHDDHGNGRPGLAAADPDVLMAGRLRMRLTGAGDPLLDVRPHSDRDLLHGDNGGGLGGAGDAQPLNRLTGTDGGVAVLDAPATLAAAAVLTAPSRPALAIAAAVAARRPGRGTEIKPLHDLLVQPMPVWKRALDLAGATAMLVLLSPVLLASAAAIKLTNRGPVLFTQRRAGLGGRPFTIFKFRTMCVDAEARKSALRPLSEQDGPAFKMARDPRVTAVGAFLRKTSLDELPQLFNVIRGDMSLVGPRPLPVDEQGAAEPWQQRRLDVTPGLTCIWQIKGRSRVTFAEWVRMDVAYMRRRTLVHDLLILLQTVPAVLLRRGAR